eukprot:CAMPEP_0115426236 /NCGR_PEP_ID=MMETSP0271-20121206/28808_1 /TAXON_ID=71861 /ORGANISM="Scrippsiella trochoidea, Strain CCMP3099" /LENGTH=77 /DNA_ID=CAMNT_0002851193 /DNA_START=15 /DNA_END=245 /DNA_ORIENTATION=+
MAGFGISGRRSSRAMTVMLVAACAAALLCATSRAFLPATPQPLERAGGAAATAAGLGAAGLGAAAPAFAEEGLLNFG